MQAKMRRGLLRCQTLKRRAVLSFDGGEAMRILAARAYTRIAPSARQARVEAGRCCRSLAARGFIADDREFVVAQGDRCHEAT
ncbi:MAG: hypothetical protein OXH92_04150 [Bryobacterales bacterium]|nr:hypothetical protein [Bryobacterales bacterium]